jgi:hypothetical protein
MWRGCRELLQQAPFGGAGLVAGGADACGVPEHVQVVALPGDAPAGSAVVRAVGEVVPPGSGGGSFLCGQGQVRWPGAECDAGDDQDERSGAVHPGAHRPAFRWPGGAGRVPRGVRVLTMTAVPR